MLQVYRATALAIVLASGFAGPAHSQSNFDATGQFYVGIKLGATGKEKNEPEFGFRFGSNTVSKTKLHRSDPVRRNLDTRFDRGDSALGFSGVELNFGKDGRTIDLLEDRVGVAGEGPATGSVDAYNLLSAGKAYRLDRGAEAYEFSTQLSSPYAWVEAPIDDNAQQLPIPKRRPERNAEAELVFTPPE